MTDKGERNIIVNRAGPCDPPPTDAEMAEAREYLKDIGIDPDGLEHWQVAGMATIILGGAAQAITKAVEEERERAEALWGLLDNIDTLDDACRNDDGVFRRSSRRYLALRHRYLASHDGQTLEVPDPGKGGVDE